MVKQVIEIFKVASSLVRGVHKASVNQVLQKDQFKKARALLWSRPLSGPKVQDLATIEVHSIEQFLETCGDIEERFPDDRLIYRGQTDEYTLDGSDVLSLLPGAARNHPTPNVGADFASNLKKAYAGYVDGVIDQHIDFIARSSHEGGLLRRLIRDPLFREVLPDGTFLANTPVGRFLLNLYQPGTLLFEAALQHYDHRTLNLDASYSPLVALYFATHRRHEPAAGVYSLQPEEKGGFVYVMDLPEEGLTLDGEGMASLASRGRIQPTHPRIANLFELTFDNESRPRRQYAILLAEVTALYWDGQSYRIPDEVQLNSYADYVRFRIRLSSRFWEDRGTHRFLNANLGAWFFPGPEIDRLQSALLSAAPKTPRYDIGPTQLQHPDGRFEFLNPWRIVLTGPDAINVRQYLTSSWHTHAGWVEQLPIERVIEIAADVEQREQLDIIVVCENDQNQSNVFAEKILTTGRKSGRTFVVLPSYVRGTSPRAESRLFVVGGETWVDFNDHYGTSEQFQRGLFNAMLELLRIRYERQMKPKPSDWRSFLHLVNTASHTDDSRGTVPLSE